MEIKNIGEFKNFVWEFFRIKFLDNGFSDSKKLELNKSLLGDGLIDSLDLLNLAVALQENSVYLDISLSEGEIDTSILGLFSMLKFDDDEVEERVEGDGIKHILTDLGIQSGDNLLLHSSFVAISSFVETPKDAVNNIFDVIGEQGTLLVPAVNIEEFKRGKFDTENSPIEGKYGAISEQVRKTPGAIRSINPFDSVCGIGPVAEMICGGYNDRCYGEESPWRKALNQNFKLVMIGVDFYYASVVHVAELDSKVPYRKWMDFKNNIIHKDVKMDFTVKLYASEMGLERHYDKVCDEFLESGDMLKKSKYIKGYVIDLDYMYNYFMTKLKENPYMFVSS